MDSQVSRGPGTRAEITPATGSALGLSAATLSRFDEFLLMAPIGRGGMAEVFLALTDGPAGFNKLVALKRLHAHLEEDPEAVEMFLREANLAARLHHPNLVHTYSAGIREGRHFIAMEYLEGQPLSRVLRRVRSEDTTLSPVVAARLVSEVLDGLHYAHEARGLDGEPLGLIHRDISPQNVFVTFDGHVKLIDFGVARVGALPSQTRVGLIKGKLNYMAPEQACGEPIDRRADLWSVGVVLRECLTGQRVFSGTSDVDVLRATISEDVPLLQEIAPQIPRDLAVLVDRALQRDRRLRYSTALEFKEALDEWSDRQNQAGGRATLAATMRALFPDFIARQKEELRACLNSIEQRGLRSVTAAAGASDSSSFPSLPYAPARPSIPVPTQHPTRILKKVTLLSAVVFAVLLAFWGSSDSTPSAVARAIVRDEPLMPAPASISASPSGPAASSPVPSTAIAFPDRPACDKDESVLPTPRTIEIRASNTHARFGRPDGAGGRPPRAATSAVVPPSVPQEPATAGAREALPHPRVEKGRLVLDSTPYAIVSLGDTRLGITPLDVELSAQTHLLTLRNPELGIETTYRVTVPARGTVNQRVALD